VALLAGVVVYAAVASDRLAEVVAGVGAAGCVLVAAALSLRRPALVPLGLTGVGAAYAVNLALRSGGADGRAPFVAAAVFCAAELAFWPGPGLGLRRLALLAVSAAATIFAGSVLLTLAAETSGGVGLGAAGAAAAVATLLALVLLARPKPQL
jgi:hypothetical protein